MTDSQAVEIQTFHGEPWKVFQGESYKSYSLDAGYDLSVVMFWTSNTDHAYVVWNNSNSEVEEYFNNAPYADWCVSSIPRILESALESLGEVEDAINDSGYEPYDADQDWEYEGGYENDSDLMNEW